MSLKLLRKSIKKALVLKIDNYHYIIHPISDGIPEIFPDMLEEVVKEIHTHINCYVSIDKIVTIESMGIPIATSLSLKMNIPFTIIRKRAYGLPEELNIEQYTGYSKSRLYINGLKKDEKIIIVDDIISTGNTLRSVLKGLNKLNVITKGVFIVVDKGNAVNKIREEFNVPITTLLKIEIKNDKVIIINK